MSTFDTPIFYIDHMNSLDWRKLGLLAIALFAAYQIGSTLLLSLNGFLMILLLAWLFSIAMEPAVSWFEDRGFRRGLGAGTVLLALLTFLITFFATFGGLMFSQLSEAVAALPDVVISVTEWLNQTFDLAINSDQVVSYLNLDSASLAPIAASLAGGFFALVTGLVTFLVDFFTILVFAFYLSAEAPKVRRGIASWLSPDKQSIFITVWDIAVKKAGGFVVSRVVLASISAVAHAAFYYIIGIPYWLPMGIFAGVTAQFIPTIGTYLGVAVPALFSFGPDPLDVVWIILFATVFQQIENYILSPRVSRATMDLHPAVALASVFIGVAIFGPIGALIGIPIVAAVIAVLATYGQRHELIDGLGAD
jgi:predicted PurR-regulated permease PerM